MEEKYSLKFIESQLGYWQSMRNKYLKSEHEDRLRLNTQKLLDQVHNITPDNSIRRFLDSTTKTVPIIDAFLQTDKMFLILLGVFRVFYNEVLHNISLVICKVYNDVNIMPSELVISNIKQNPNQFISSLSQYNGTRFYELVSLILELSLDNKKEGEIMSFSLPCQFNAQGSVNRSGYGNVYNGEDLVHEGTHYGETTMFAIIGIILD